jgi:hypothetical protein
MFAVKAKEAIILALWSQTDGFDKPSFMVTFLGAVLVTH